MTDTYFKPTAPGNYRITVKSLAVMLIFAVALIIGIVSALLPDLMLWLISILIWLLCLCLLIKLGSFKFISPIGFFFIIYTLFIYTGGLILFFSGGKGAAFTSGEHNYQFFLAITVGLFGLCLGALFANISAGYKPKEETTLFREKPWADTLKGGAAGLCLGILSVLAITCTLVYVTSRGVLPLIQALESFGLPESYAANIASRIQFTAYGEGGGSYFFQGYFGQFYQVVLPFSALFSMAKFLYSKDKRWMASWIGLSLIAAFFLMLSLQRWRILVFIILTFLVYNLYRFRLGKGSILAVTLAGVCAYAFLGVARGIPVDFIFQDFTQRILLGQIIDTYPVFEIYPEYADFRYGYIVFNDLWGLLPGPNIGSGTLLYALMYPNSLYIGSASTSYGMLGELYADFGLAWLIGSMAVYGFVMQVSLIWFVRSKKSLLKLVFFAFLIMSFGWLALSGFVGFLDLCLMGVVICVVFMVVVTSILRLKSIEEHA